MMKTRIAFFVFLFACVSISYADARKIEVVAQKSYYTPDHINLKKGETVKLSIRSADVTHGFAIDEFDIAREVPVGPPVEIEFTPDKTGTFTYYCVVRCGHDHRRMHGTLTVED
jgi:heme/copper-type cytochrome/quinol oxidase subunit 2